MKFHSFVKNIQILLPSILVALVVLPNSAAADWQVTQYLAVGATQSLKPYTNYRVTTEASARITVFTTTTYTYSYTTTLVLTASPTSPSVVPSRTSTYTDTYDHITYTKYYLPLASFPDPSALPTQDYYDVYGYLRETGTGVRTRTIWLQELTSTAPSFCTSKWTYTDAETVYPPTAVYPQLTPTSISDSTYSTSTTSRIYLTRPDGYYETETTVLPMTTVYAFKYLSPGTVPTSTFYDDGYHQSWYISLYGEVTGASRYTSYICSNPFPYATIQPTSYSGAGNSYGSSSQPPSSDKTGDERTNEIVEWLKQSGSYDYYTDAQLRKIAEQMQYESWAAWMWSRKSVKAGVISAVVIVAVLFLGGFVESFLWFGRLMTGRSAIRGGTICWAIMTVWGVCLTKREKAVQDKDRQTEMTLKWEEMGFGEKMSLWKKYGMKWRYPVDILGPREGVRTGGNNIPIVTVTEVDQLPAVSNHGRDPVLMTSIPEEQTAAPTAPTSALTPSPAGPLPPSPAVGSTSAA